LQDRFFLFLAHASQAPVGQSEPLVLGLAISWPAEGVGFPAPVGFRRILAPGGNHAHGKRREPGTGVAQQQARHHRASGKDMLGQVDIEREAAENLRRGDAGNQNGRKHRGNDHVEQVVARVDGGDSDDDADEDVDQTGARYVIIHRLADARGNDSPRQVRDGGQADKSGEQQRRRGQNNGSPDAARFARDRGKKRGGERQHQAHDGQQKSHPELRESQPTTAQGSRGWRDTLLARGNRLADQGALRCRVTLLPAYDYRAVSGSDRRNNEQETINKEQ